MDNYGGTHVAETTDGKLDDVAGSELGGWTGHRDDQWYGETFPPWDSVPVDHVRLLADLDRLVNIHST